MTAITEMPQEAEAAVAATVDTPDHQVSPFDTLQALGKRVAGLEHKEAGVYMEVAKEALRLRTSCTTEDDIRRLQQEAKKAGLIKRPPRDADPALVTPLILSAVFSQVKSKAGDSTRSRLTRIVDYAFESGRPLDELVQEHKGFWAIYGAWRKAKAVKQPAAAPTTISVRLVIDRALGERVMAGKEAPRFVWDSVAEAFALESVSVEVAAQVSPAADATEEHANENVTPSDDTLAMVLKAAGATDEPTLGNEVPEPAGASAGEVEGTPDEAELQAALDKYQGRLITIGHLGGGAPFKRFLQHVTFIGVSPAGEKVYKIHRVTPELLHLLKKGAAAVAQVAPEAMLAEAVEKRVARGGHQ
jgi:hypothetical protein